jgi:hypothetical protein
MQYGRTFVIDIVMVAAAFFAIVMVMIGFLVAVNFYRPAQTTASGSEPLTMKQKKEVLQNLAASEQRSSSATGSPTSNAAPLAQVSPLQADPQDPYAAQKLQILDSLNSQ